MLFYDALRYAILYLAIMSATIHKTAFIGATYTYTKECTMAANNINIASGFWLWHGTI